MPEIFHMEQNGEHFGDDICTFCWKKKQVSIGISNGFELSMGLLPDT